MGSRVVLDTNVFISALGWDGKPEACLEQVLQEQVDGYISPAMVDELRRVMDYPRFGFTDAEKQSFQEIILNRFM
jgi:putative PIN family toxin of toxin-antitoxin system